MGDASATQITRSPDHDYHTPGVYFVTFCTEHRVPLLGKLVTENIALTGIGKMVQTTIQESHGRYPGIEIDCFGLMPDHVHMIIWLRDVEPRTSIPDYMNRLKSMIAKRYQKIRIDYPRLPQQLMQRSYYDRYIRDDPELLEFRQYILNNPLALKLRLEGHIV